MSLFLSALGVAFTKRGELGVSPISSVANVSTPPIHGITEHAFGAAKEIDWKQGAGIRKGDVVFMYAGAPVSAILYKCKVAETDIPYQYQRKGLTITSLMRIRLMKKYKPDRFTFELLKAKYRIFTMRGPRGIPENLSAAPASVSPFCWSCLSGTKGSCARR